MKRLTDADLERWSRRMPVDGEDHPETHDYIDLIREMAVELMELCKSTDAVT